MSFDDAFAHTVGLEGGYSNNPADPGGATMYGITEQVARSSGYEGAMKDLPLDTAKTIYRAKYWSPLSLDAVDALSSELAAKLFDMAVNCGDGISAAFLQIALNAFNRRGKDYPDVGVDRVLGPSTLEALRAFLARRGEQGVTVLLRALNVQQGARYLALAGRDGPLEDFEFGWFLERVS